MHAGLCVKVELWNFGSELTLEHPHITSQGFSSRETMTGADLADTNDFKGSNALT